MVWTPGSPWPTAPPACGPCSPQAQHRAREAEHLSPAQRARGWRILAAGALRGVGWPAAPLDASSAPSDDNPNASTAPNAPPAPSPAENHGAEEPQVIKTNEAGRTPSSQSTPRGTRQAHSRSSCRGGKGVWARALISPSPPHASWGGCGGTVQNQGLLGLSATIPLKSKDSTNTISPPSPVNSLGDTERTSASFWAFPFVKRECWPFGE